MRHINSLRLTADSLTVALTGVRDSTMARMPGEARRSISSVVKNGARDMIAEPFRLDRVLTRSSERSLAALISECNRRCNGMRDLGRAGHWTYDLNLHLALQQARLALRYMRRFGEVR